MSRVSVGTPNWGGPLNTILDEIEAKADDALEQLENITIQDATTTVKGVVKLSTSSQAIAGTDSITAVTPVALAAALAALVDASPGTLDTLNELAAALGDDPNFATTMAAAIAGKISSLSYANALAGTRFTMPYNGTSGFINLVTGTVASARPSARTDIFFDLSGGNTSVSDPAWMINGDAREIVV